MTLIELLVVIIILTTIVAAAIPLMSPSNDDRRLREAARGLNTFITGAAGPGDRAQPAVRHRAQAAVAGHARRARHDNGVCLEVFYVEQPPPYAGFDANSRACVAHSSESAGLVLVRFVTRGTTAPTGLPVGWDADLFPTGMIRPGDVIEINGTRFELLRRRHNGNVTIDPTPDVFETRRTQPAWRMIRGPAAQRQRPADQSASTTTAVARLARRRRPQPPYWTDAAPYKILRQPTPTSDEPYQLPEGTAIDLRASGVGSRQLLLLSRTMNDNDEGILIMFAPEGRCRGCRTASCPSTAANDRRSIKPVVDNVFLLVGQRENVPPPMSTSDPTLQSAAMDRGRRPTSSVAKLREPINWLSGSSRWVVIGSQSGRDRDDRKCVCRPDCRSCSKPLALPSIEDECATNKSWPPASSLARWGSWGEGREAISSLAVSF